MATIEEKCAYKELVFAPISEEILRDYFSQKEIDFKNEHRYMQTPVSPCTPYSPASPSSPSSPVSWSGD